MLVDHVEQVNLSFYQKRAAAVYTTTAKKKGNKNMKFIKKSIVENLIDYKYLKKKRSIENKLHYYGFKKKYWQFVSNTCFKYLRNFLIANE